MVTGVRVTRKRGRSELKVGKLKECGEVGIILGNMQQRANEREWTQTRSRWRGVDAREVQKQVGKSQGYYLGIKKEP
jgi:hypothetical protein